MRPILGDDERRGRAARGTSCGLSSTVLAIEALRSERGPLVRVGPPLRFGPATGDGREITLSPDADVAALAARTDLGEGLAWIRVD